MRPLRTFVSLILVAAALVYMAGFLAPDEAAPEGLTADDLDALSMPWSRLADLAPEALWPTLVTVAPWVDAVLLLAVAVLIQLLPRKPRLRSRARSSAGGERATLVGATVFAVTVTALLAWWLVDPAPPSSIRMATGPEGGFYERLGRRYAYHLGRNGVDVELVATAGTPENLALLHEPDVSVGFVQGGVATNIPDDTPLRALTSLEIEPLWLFAREQLALSDLLARGGLVVAAGPSNSGTYAFVRRVFMVMGIEESVVWEPIGGEEATEALVSGEVDIAAFVTAPGTDAVTRLLENPDIAVVEADGLDALLRRLSFTHSITMPPRILDFGANLPPDEVVLLGTAASLVVRQELHPAIKQLLLQVSASVARGDRLIGTYGEFPSKDLVQFPLDPEADRFFSYGPTAIRRYLPYWGANLLERFWVVIIPVATLLFPILRFGPSTLAWGIRRRIYRHYKDLKELEASAEAAETAGEKDKVLRRMDDIDEQLKDVNVPLPYRDDLYRLRVHAAFVRDRLTTPDAGGSNAP